MSNKGVHFNKELDTKLKRICQTAWEITYNKSDLEFIKAYGRNYL